MDGSRSRPHIRDMSNASDNLVLELLRAMRSDIGAIRDILTEHGQRLTRIETGLASVRRETAGDAEDIAQLHARLDRMRDEIDRIKRRLDIADS